MSLTSPIACAGMGMVFLSSPLWLLSWHKSCRCLCRAAQSLESPATYTDCMYVRTYGVHTYELCTAHVLHCTYCMYIHAVCIRPVQGIVAQDTQNWALLALISPFHELRERRGRMQWPAKSFVLRPESSPQCSSQRPQTCNGQVFYWATIQVSLGQGFCLDQLIDSRGTSSSGSCIRPRLCLGYGTCRSYRWLGMSLRVWSSACDAMPHSPVKIHRHSYPAFQLSNLPDT